ncbi:MAG: hypothetical protein JRG81_13340 [Deltaproteobacteria bacterium]|nr:hypothetical protein [Deltaproteobacteria bacterium]MBW2181330.1 hypothetical protein [Deltaproteobacteria bacterium]
MTDKHLSGEMEVVGFWLRAWATAIDTFLILAVTFPLLFLHTAKPILNPLPSSKAPWIF